MDRKITLDCHTRERPVRRCESSPMQSNKRRALFVTTAAIGLGAAFLLATSAPAVAGSSRQGSGGALSQTTRAVSAKTNPSGSSGGSSSSSNDSSSSSDSYDYDDGSGYYTGAAGCYSCTRPTGLPPEYSGSGPTMSLKMGLQSVKDSDGAAMAAMRVRSGSFGLAISGTHYFEQAPAADGSDTVYLNIWAITGQARLIDSERSSLWLQGGLSGTTSNNGFEPLLGATLGAEVEHVVNRTIDIYASGRYYVLQEGVHAIELRAGVGLSFLTLGYRTFDFYNVDGSVPLHGPEFGVSLGF